jgi:hypothetical protein
MTDEVEKFTPYRKAGGHRTKGQKQAEMLEVLRMKRLGYLDSQVAEALNMSIPTVHVRRREALELFGESTVEEYRKEIGQQYDILLQATIEGVQAKDEKMIAAATRILQAKARLVGADQPAQVEMTVTVETEQEKRLAEVFAKMEADQAAAEEEIVDAEVVE